ncbi:putative reverse transcriptase domain-containing protein [Tanacetum coccineum]
MPKFRTCGGDVEELGTELERLGDACKQLRKEVEASLRKGKPTLFLYGSLDRRGTPALFCVVLWIRGVGLPCSVWFFGLEGYAYPVLYGSLDRRDQLLLAIGTFHWFLPSVDYSHVVNSNGIHVDPSKIKAVRNRKAPKTPLEIRSFLGLAGYYQRFIVIFSKIVKPLTSLLKKNQKYKWGVEQEEAFYTLKDNLCNAPILSLFDEAEDFVVYCNALNKGLSSIKEKLLASQYEASKEENAPVKMLRGLDQQLKKKKDGGLYFINRIWVPLIGDVTTIIMDEAYATRHSIHLGADKMYYDLQDMYWWPEALGTRLYMCTTYHPQTDGQSEYTIQNLEDMLRACVIDFGGSWDTHLPLAVFSYNNSYHSSIRCATFEVLYGRKCRSPVLWAEVGDNRLIGLEMVKETTDKVVLIRERIKAARDRVLKVSPWKGAVCFGKKGKLAPRYVGPFEILERIGPIAYRLRFPQEWSSVHDTIHVSNLEKCLADANLHVSLEEIRVDKTLHFVEEPKEIMDREVIKLKQSRIPIVKVYWNSKRGPEFTGNVRILGKIKGYTYYVLFGSLDQRSTPTLFYVVLWICLPYSVWFFGSEGYAYPVLYSSLDRMAPTLLCVVLWIGGMAQQDSMSDELVIAEMAKVPRFCTPVVNGYYL